MTFDTIDIADFDQLERLRDYIDAERPGVIRTSDGSVLTGVAYSCDDSGAYAEIGICLPLGMCVALEGRSEPTLGVLEALRIWLPNPRQLNGEES